MKSRKQNDQQGADATRQEMARSQPDSRGGGNVISHDWSTRYSWGSLALYLPLILVAVGAYWNSFQGAFVFDDTFFIKNNPYITKLWSTDYLFEHRHITRPLMGVVLALNYAACGLAPWGWHLVNLLIHIGCACLLHAVLTRTFDAMRHMERKGVWKKQNSDEGWISRRDAMLVTMGAVLIWTAHPLLTESVTYVIQRNESLMALLMMGSLYCAMLANEMGRKKWLWGVSSVLLSALAMCTKQVAVVLPLLIVIHDLLFTGLEIKELLRRRVWLYAGLALTWLILPVLLAGGVQSRSAGFGLNISPFDYARSQPVVICHYLRLAIFPDSLCLDYRWPVESDPLRIIPAVALLMLPLAWAVIWRRKYPLYTFWTMWFYLILAPTSTIMPIEDLAAERRMYLPLFSICLALVMLVRYAAMNLLKFSPRMVGASVAAFAVFSAGVLGMATHERNKAYYTDLETWKDIVQKRPESSRGHNNYGAALEVSGKSDEALAEYELALKIRPDYADAHVNTGIALLRRNKFYEAAAHFIEVLRIKEVSKVPDQQNETRERLSGMIDRIKPADYTKLKEAFAARGIKPDEAQMNYRMAEALYAKGRADEAKTYVMRSVAADPNRADAQVALGAVLDGEGNYKGAIACYERAIQSDPKQEDAWNNYGSALMALNKKKDALDKFLNAVEVNPKNADARLNSGVTLVSLGQYGEALIQLRELLKLRPDDSGGQINAGMALTGLQRWQEAVPYFEAASKMREKQPDLFYYWGSCLEGMGRIPEAVEKYRKALALHPGYKEPRERLKILDIK